MNITFHGILAVLLIIDTCLICQGTEILLKNSFYFDRPSKKSLEDLTPKRSKSFEHTVGSKIVQVFRIAQHEGKLIKDLPPNSDYYAEFDIITQFYLQNSGGKLQLSFEIFDEYLYDSSYTKSNCEESICAVGVPYLNHLTNLGSNYHYVIILEGYCPCLKFRGLGELLKDKVWINGFPNWGIVSHELGHNLGASHANIGNQEYANYLSIMGTGEDNLNSHFSVIGKVQFGWLSPLFNLNIFARKQMCFNSSKKFKNCEDTCTVLDPCFIKLFAHDKGYYEPNNTYGIKVLTSDPNESIWLEYRSGFSPINKGLLALWGYEKNTSYEGVSNYGPTQLLVNRLQTSFKNNALSNAPLMPGETQVFDLDNTGLVVSVVAADALTSFIEVSLYFTELLASDFPYHQKGLLLDHTNNNWLCGKQYEYEFNQKNLYQLSSFWLEDETSLEVLIRTTCEDNYTLVEGAGFYFYQTYPLQLELNQDFDPSRGAYFFIPLTCYSFGTLFESEGNIYSRTTVNFHNQVSANRKQETFPSYIDFSSANYILLFSNNSTNIHSTIVFNESLQCSSFCEILKVDFRDESINFIHQKDGYFSDNNNRYRIILDNDNVWKLVDFSSGGIISINQDINIKHVHLTTNWEPQLEISCMERLSFERYEIEYENTFIIKVFALGVVISILTMIVVYLIIRIYLDSEYPREWIRRSSSSAFSGDKGKMINLFKSISESSSFSMERTLLTIRKTKYRCRTAWNAPSNCESELNID